MIKIRIVNGEFWTETDENGVEVHMEYPDIPSAVQEVKQFLKDAEHLDYSRADIELVSFTPQVLHPGMWYDLLER